MKTTITLLIALGLAVPVFAADPQGREVFDKVCAKCHGENGGGSPSADNFYKMTIPRLNSDQVQKMSDAEIKDVIVKGRRTMKPPLPGTPYMQHKVAPELLDSLVSHIRTLKKAT